MLEVPDITTFEHDLYVARFDQFRRWWDERAVMTVDNAPRHNDEDGFWFITARMTL